MGNKIFISYKYKDDCVYHQLINGAWMNTVRDYVTVLQNKIETEHINKGEPENEDLSELSEVSIEKKLKDRLYDSSVTLIIMSPKMKELSIPENKQWIPWEISYSLRPVTRNERTCQRNALVAIVLPDANGSYDYAIVSKNCVPGCSCNVWQTQNFFPIISSNMFNLKSRSSNKKDCISHNDVYMGEVSYISLVRWEDFYKNPDKYIQQAIDRQKNADDYDLKILLQNSVS